MTGPKPRCLTLRGAASRIISMFLGLAFSSSSSAATCGELIANLSRLTAANSVDLVSKAGSSTTFKQLYDECDRKDTFAGQKLPARRRCSSEPNHVEFVRKYGDGTIVFKAKMAVDADGAPSSRGSGASTTDNPQTWLTFDAGSETSFVNAEDVPFVVVPLAAPTASGVSFRKQTGIGKGDLAVVISRGRCSFGVVGDAGPYFRLGEASVAAHKDLGNPQCSVADEYPCKRLKAGGSGAGIASGVTYLVFPNSRPTPLLSQTVVAQSTKLAAARLEVFLAQQVK